MQCTGIPSWFMDIAQVGSVKQQEVEMEGLEIDEEHKLGRQKNKSTSFNRDKWKEGSVEKNMKSVN